MPAAPNARAPSLNGLPASGGSMNSAREVTYGISSRVPGGVMPTMSSRWAMREASPASFLRTSCNQDDSLRRWITRWTLMPHV